MTRGKQLAIIGLCALIAGASILPLASRSERARAAGAAASQPAALPEELIKKVSAIDMKLQDQMPTISLLADPEFRKLQGPVVGPLLNQLVAVFEQIDKATASDQVHELVQLNRYRFLGMLAALDDKEATAQLDKDASSPGVAAISAKSALLMGGWLKSSADPSAQEKILRDFESVIKANPDNEILVGTMGFIANVGASNSDTSKKVIDLVRNDMKGAAADAMVQALATTQSKREMAGKPLVLAGETNTGEHFSTSQWKGKVVLIDFWATWCPPCVAEMPQLKKLYADNHAKGLEMLGVSSDDSAEPVNAFVKENGVGWPSLVEKASDTELQHLHSLNRKFGFLAIPCKILIDKKGVVRYLEFGESTDSGPVRVTAGDHPNESLETQVARLIAEPAQ